jgi:hypothetical protein
MNISPKRRRYGAALSVFACVCTILFCVATGRGYAADVGCNTVFDAMLRLPTVPSHSFTTMQMPGVGKITSEMINDGKKLYILQEGKWKVSPMTAQDLIAQEKENIRNNKTTCSVVRDEAIDGVGSTLYSIEESDTDGTTKSQVWISKASGLPVHVKLDTPADTRYVYSGVAAPAVN